MKKLKDLKYLRTLTRDSITTIISLASFQKPSLNTSATSSMTSRVLECLDAIHLGPKNILFKFIFFSTKNYKDMKFVANIVTASRTISLPSVYFIMVFKTIVWLYRYGFFLLHNLMYPMKLTNILKH